ncbi:cytochrome P450 family protein [Halomonas jincaotanensis]|uniref:hypothetical protein n=1 Tax=Halomonas jincaotanensis TaxID=2810616 RepID=UPI00202312AA|nr:hypothetical protein [Halomonas jincaotanensis]
MTEPHSPTRRFWLGGKRADEQDRFFREALGELALEFDGVIRELLASRREAGDAAPDDVTTRIMNETVEGRALTDEEIVSILRNWTVGELGTISSSIGILMNYLALNPKWQERLRANRSLLPAVIDEILRLDAPLMSNRRITTPRWRSVAVTSRPANE